MQQNEKCNFKTHVVLMKGITWSRDSHGLFDYESRHLTKKTMKSNNPIQIIRLNNDLEFTDLNSVVDANPESQIKPLLNIINENDTFYLESCSQLNSKVESRELNEQMYLVVRSLKHNNQKIEYDIQQGDILKVGRVKFAVKEIRYKEKMEVDQTQDDEYLEYDEVENIISNQAEDDGQTHQTDEERPRCRFCWSSAADLMNPLFSSCKCSGSVGYIHFTCLRSWLDVKKQCKMSTNFSSYYWKAFECEICKKAYPLMLKTNGKSYNLVQYDRPEGDYLVLESLNQEKNNSRIIHIIKPGENKDSFKFGRGHESDLRINDISVSRCHAIIKFKDHKFQLEDNMSKFGTLVLVKQRTPLIPGFNKAVQIGRTVINFSVKSIVQGKNFGPRPQDGLIKGKVEDRTHPLEQKILQPNQEEMEGEDNEHDSGNQDNLQPFEMAISHEGSGSGFEEGKNQEIPNEIPDNRKTKFF